LVAVWDESDVCSGGVGGEDGKREGWKDGKVESPSSRAKGGSCEAELELRVRRSLALLGMKQARRA
jgi:hypothetical protein